MIVTLKDFIQLVEYDIENINIFDEKRYEIIFSGIKIDIYDEILKNPTIANKKVNNFYILSNIIYVSVE